MNQVPGFLLWKAVVWAHSYYNSNDNELACFGRVLFHLSHLQDCLALGAIFSATDSVATLQVLSADSHPVLFSLVFGEVRMQTLNGLLGGGGGGGGHLGTARRREL
jgi:hypothetical protein